MVFAFFKFASQTHRQGPDVLTCTITHCNITTLLLHSSSVLQNGWSCYRLTCRASTDVRLLDLWICLPTETHPTLATSSTSSVFALESSARLPWSVMRTLRLSRFTTRATRCHAMPRLNARHHAAPTRAAQSLTSGTHRTDEYQMLRFPVSICTLD